MDLPKDKGQTEYQVVSVFSISVVFATLDTKGTANLRDIPNPTPLTPSQPHKAVDCHCFTLITKRPTGRTELTSWSMLRWESTCSKATGTSSASKGQQNAVGEGGILGELCTGHKEPKARFSAVRVSDLRVSGCKRKKTQVTFQVHNLQKDNVLSRTSLLP